jgi:NAD(P)H-dependent FMN reductase
MHSPLLCLLTLLSLGVVSAAHGDLCASLDRSDISPSSQRTSDRHSRPQQPLSHLPKDTICELDMQAAARRIGVIVGSSRRGGNGAGIGAWVSQQIQREADAFGVPFNVVTVDPRASPHPFGPVTDGSRLPAQVTNSEDYSSPAIREWSKFVKGCSAFAIVSPEYNGGYPGELKNSIDHLYHEWANKPVLLLTYGSGGGLRVSAQLQTILTSIKMQVLDKPLAVKIPPGYISGPDRVQANSTTFPEFLTEYEPQVTKAVQDMARKLLTPPESS